MDIERPLKRSRSFANQIGAVASVSAPEKKNVDGGGPGTLTGAAANTWSAVTLVNGITQGATANTRVGRRVTLISFLMRWAVSNTNAPTRIMIVYDHAPNGALPAITDILTFDGFTAVNNLINNDRFIVLHDEIVNLLQSSTIFGGKTFIKRQPLQMQYTNAATGTIADITTGAVYIMACSISGVAANVQYTFRTRFTDL